MYSNVLTVNNDINYIRQSETAERPLREPVCAACCYSHVFAVQPRVVCAHASAMRAGRILCAGEAACADFAPRSDKDLSLSTVDASRRAAPYGLL